MRLSGEAMRRLRHKRALLSAAVLAATLAVAVGASAHWHSGGYEHGGKDTTCTGRGVDPVGVVFHGTAATIRYLGGNHGDINFHTNWTEHSPEADAYYETYSVCKKEDDQVAESFGFPRSRYHIRLWQLPQDYSPGKHAVAGTPHHENWIWYRENNGCGTPYPWNPGNHAIDPGAVDRGAGYQREFGPSGYDKARSYLARAFHTNHHTIEHVDWHNSASHRSCEGYWVGSNGTVDLISVGTP